MAMPKGTVVVTIATLGLRVKIFDLAVSKMVACAFLSSWGRHRGAQILLGLVSAALVASLALLVLCFLIFYLLCKRFSSSPLIGSAICGFIYKAEQKTVSRCYQCS
jgi:hypothetical protein